MDSVRDHESELTADTLEQLQKVPDLKIFGDTDPDSAHQRLGVIPFRVLNHSHFLTAAALGYEYGIGVRSDYFCVHPYILHLLDLNHDQARSVRNRMLSGDKTGMPGLVRISYGLYNTQAEIDAFINALKDIVRGDYQGIYIQERSSGEYYPQGWVPDFNHYYSLSPS